MSTVPVPDPDLVRSIAAHGLPGALSPWPEQPLGPVAWAQLSSEITRQRLDGLLIEALSSGVLPATDEQRAAASHAHFTRVCSILILESEALQVLTALAGAGIDAKVLKGTAVAHLDYPDPAQRMFADVDVLVRSQDVDAAVRMLTSRGHVRQSVQPRPGFDRRFGKGATFVSPSGYEFDLHRTFVMGPFGLRLHLEDLWERPAHFELGGRRVGALDAECRFLHACFHTALGDAPARLVPQRDIAQMLLFGDLDLARVDRLMRSWQAEPVVARAVGLTWESLRLSDITALSTWARRYVPGPRAHKDIAVYVDPASSSYAAKSVAAIAALPTAREKAAFALALALPRRGFVPAAHGTAERWRRAVSSAAGRTSWSRTGRP